MFERFTPHAQRVLELEGLEAQKMHHAHLGTEHLLLGLLREPQGHGHRALEKLGVTLKQARAAIESVVAAGPSTQLPDSFHQTEHARRVMSLAVEQARKLKHSHIGTEHLLLGLLEEPDGVAYKSLSVLNLKPTQVRDEVLTMLAQESGQ